MAVGSSKIGKLGGLVPGGSVTFNSSDTFVVPPGVRTISVTGRGSTGSPGNPGNPGNPGTAGNPGNPGTGAPGGQSGTPFGSCFPNRGYIAGQTGGAMGMAYNSVTFGQCVFSTNVGQTSGPSNPFRIFNSPAQVGNVPADPTNSTSGNSGSSGNSGTSGTTGSAGTPGSAGNPGNPGNASSAFCYNFTGGVAGNAGAAGNAGPAGAAGNAGTGGSGGSGGGGPGGGGGGGNGGGSGGSGANQAKFGPTGPPHPSAGQFGGGGGGGAGTTNSGRSGQSGNWAANTPTVTTTNQQFTAGSHGWGGSSPPFQCFGAPNQFFGRVGNCMTYNAPFVLNQAAHGGFGGFPGSGPCFHPEFIPRSPGNGAPNTWKVNTQGMYQLPACQQGIVLRQGAGGGAAGYRWHKITGQLNNNYQPSAGGGGGGGRGNAGNAAPPAPSGGAGGAGGSGGAATPVTHNCVPVSPGGSYPVTVASPGGSIVISWNPQ